MKTHKAQIGTLLVLIWLALPAGKARLLAQDSAAVARDTATGAALPPHDTTFVVDRVLAVVGNRPVLASQVEEEIFSRQSQGVRLPNDPAGLRAIRHQIVSSI